MKIPVGINQCIIMIISHLRKKGSPFGVIVNVLDYDTVVSVLTLQSHYYIHFWTNTLGKGMNHLISPAMG